MDSLRSYHVYLYVCSCLVVIINSQGEKTIFSCFTGNKEQNLTISCDDGDIINVQEAKYGRNQWNTCYYLIGDCTEDIDEADVCHGENSCQISIRKGYSPICGYVTYFRLTYKCVHVGGLALSGIQSETVVFDKETTNHIDEFTATEAWHDAMGLLPRGNNQGTLNTNPTEQHVSQKLVIALGCVTAVILVTSLVIIVLILINLHRRGFCGGKEKGVKRHRVMLSNFIYAVTCHRQCSPNANEADNNNPTYHNQTSKVPATVTTEKEDNIKPRSILKETEVMPKENNAHPEKSLNNNASKPVATISNALHDLPRDDFLASFPGGIATAHKLDSLC